MGDSSRHVAEDPRGGAEAAAPAVAPPVPLAAPQLTSGAFAASPTAVLALQRTAGNVAVQRVLSAAGAPPRLARDKRNGGVPPPSGPQYTLPPGKHVQWHRRGMDFVVAVSKQWLLDKGVASDATSIDASVFQELTESITEVAPWADPAVVKKNAKALTLDAKLADVPAVVPIRISPFLASFIGPEPGKELFVQPGPGGGATVFVDTTVVRRHLPDPTATVFSDQGFSTLAFAALEQAVGLTLGAGEEPGFRTGLYRDWEWVLPVPVDQAGRSVNLRMDESDMETVFGDDWRERATKKTSKDAGRVKGSGIQLPAAMKDDWPQIMAVLRELVGPPDPKKAKDEPTRAMSEREATLLLKIAKSPQRDKIVARLKSATGTAKPGTVLADALESVIAEQELGDARKRLDLGDPGSGGEDPVVNRPVHGNIVLTTGRPVPDKQAKFTFEVTDEVDALRSPIIRVHWFAYPQGKPDRVFETERNTYSPLRADNFLNDKIFEVTFPSAQTYVIEAIVGHNFFRPAAFRTEVKVLTEQQEADYQEKAALAGFAAPGGGTTSKHDFDVGGLSETLGAYDEGTVTRGKLDPKFKAPTLKERLDAVDKELERVENLRKQYESKPGDQASAIRNWADDYLETLRAGRKRVEDDAKDARVIPCTGVYVGRSKKAPSKALDLICLQRRTADGYHVSLHDLSQVYESDNYFYEVDNDTAEGAYEEIFVEQAKTYPDGTLSVAFQGWDEKKDAPKDGEYVKFRLVTDTVGGDIKQTVFDPAVDIAVNLAAAVMLVIPGLQAAGFALGVAWNTAKTLTELEAKAEKGTLKDKDLGMAAAQFMLDVLPVVGRSSRLVSLGKRAFYVIEGVQLAGQVVLVGVEAADAIEKVRNGVIAKLARVSEQIAQMERINPSNPELEKLKAEQDKLIQEGTDAVIEIGGKIALEQSVVAVAGGVVQAAAIKKFGARLGQLENLGRFSHREGEPVRYDFGERKIVGDRMTMTEAQFERAERIAHVSERLERAVPDDALRQRIVDGLGDGSIEVVTGAKKTRLETAGDGKVLHVADGARPDEILSALGDTGGTATPPKAPPGGTPPDDPGPLKPPTPPTPGPVAGPQFGLDEAHTKKLLDAVSPDEAKMLHDFLGDAHLRTLTKKQAGSIRLVAERVAEAKAAAGADPRALAGLERMGTKDRPTANPMSAGTIADVLATVPPGRMELFLRVVGDPDTPHPRRLGANGLKRLAGSRDELGFIGEHGGKAYAELSDEKTFPTLLEKLRDAEPGTAHKLVADMRTAKTHAERLKVLEIEEEVRTPQRATGQVAPRKGLPGWDKHMEKAAKFAEDHRGQTDRKGRPYNATDEQIEMLATMLQVRENARTNRSLPHDKRVQLLDEFDQLGREAGLQTTWINNLRGNMSEVLFSPNLGAGKNRLKHPDGGFTILDYSFEAGTRPGSKTGRKEWVEQKSDLITAPEGSDKAFGPAVARAKRYADDAALDMKALNAHGATRGDTILIEFVRRPGNDATRDAMLRALFADGSPIQAVKFADGPWIERVAFLAGK